eukprot:TRINITY_DN61234_c0_g1_i1.p1 TRINITY_DN61234_c0_g1~~TRINITY_DN61234_c0_g1_i1.p1  ORF type:complete len:724 (+),score=118.71 TRINITY_DN61234_c0_g1_i1:86-2257(+)
MDSLEDVDLVRSLNFTSSLNFVKLVELELAGLVLAASSSGCRGETSCDNDEIGDLSKKGEKSDAIVAKDASQQRCCRLRFPPLKPRYATLLHATTARFGLAAFVRGWGDERHIIVETRAGSKVHLPALQCTDFRPISMTASPEGASSDVCGSSSVVAARLADVARPSLPHTQAKHPTAVSGCQAEESKLEASGAASPTTTCDQNAVEVAPVATTRQDENRRDASRFGGMHGWSDDESSADDLISKRRRAKNAVSEGGCGGENSPDGGETRRVKRGRGFNAETEAVVETVDDTVQYELQQDYTKYAIDPQDTWRPHRKPWVELGGSWAFSEAWSFEPDIDDQRVASRQHSDDDALPRGVLSWRVEHSKGGDFSVALVECSQIWQARRWLEGNDGPGQEPFVFEFRLDVPGRRWEFRFGRTSSRRAWRPLPWSNAHRTSFWVASYPGEDGKQHVLAGIDEFPERRFFCGKLHSRPRVVGFGPPAVPLGGVRPFFIRDVVIFGRASLLPPPFASRDHIVELTCALSRDEAEAFVRKNVDVAERVVMLLPLSRSVLGSSNNCVGGEAEAMACARRVYLLLCRSAIDAVAVSDALLLVSPGGAVPAEATAAVGVLCLQSSQWTWPPQQVVAAVETRVPRDPSNGGDSIASREDDGPAAAKAHADTSRACWAKLDNGTALELAIFEEHLLRKTKHLEGTRIATSSAARMIIRNLKGSAPLPKPPEVFDS